MRAHTSHTPIDRILASDATDRVKILKLQNLALRCMPSSPAQKEVIAAYKALEATLTKEPSHEDV